MYHLKTYANAGAFLAENESSLREKTALHNLILGLSEERVGSENRDKATLFCAVFNAERPLGQLIRTGVEHGVLLSDMPLDILPVMVDYLAKEACSFPGIQGPEEVSLRFCELWKKQSAQAFEVQMGQGVFELKTLIEPAYGSGEMRRAKDAKSTFLKNAVRGFIEECFPEQELTEEGLERQLQRLLGDRSLYYWEDKGQPVAIVSNHRNYKDSATISYVYTPPEYRGKGYATQLVASLTAALLESGKTSCNLFTDLANPTSNKIYQKLGYQRVGTCTQYKILNQG